MNEGDKAPTSVPGALANSWQGLRWALTHEWSLRRQLLGSLALMGVMGLIRPALTWWILATLSGIGVMALELINTAIEVLIDHIHPERHERIQIAKDLASAAVVLGNLGQAVVGITVIVLAWRGLA